MSDKKWHYLEQDDVGKELHTDLDKGLTQQEATARQQKWGRNELPEPEKEAAILKFLRHFHDVLIYVLMAAAVITFILGHYIDTVVILLVAVINAIIGYVQENKAEKALDGIRRMLSSHATVIRDGARIDIPTADVVPGDLVVLSAGDKIPADIRIVQAEHLKVEESLLTGESTSVQKQRDALPEHTVLADRTNMVFSGTSVASGSGVGIVIGTGEQTQIGKINTSISTVDEIQTPLLKQTAKFGKMISAIILFGACAMFLFGYIFHDYETSELLLAVIGLTVAAIPEGLPAILSIILAIGVQTMASNNAIVRNLPSVETLGSVSVICSDKTGTLTKNEMTVRSVMMKEKEYEVKGVGYSPQGHIFYGDEEVDLAQHGSLKQFLTCVKTVNEASLREDEENQWIISGEPTEGCLITLSEKANEPIGKLAAIAKIPFDSSYKYMAVLVEESGEKIIYVKGAPDRLFDMSGLVEGSEEHKDWETKMKAHAQRGERIIGAAMIKVDPSMTEIKHSDIEQGLTMLGLAGIIDPPREEAIIAVQECFKAGIMVKMITGDHKETAMAIGSQMGIGDGKKAIEGRELDQMTDDELAIAAEEYDIFARTSPENKLHLVQALQQQGHVCAMTGDGVNDAPALKRADIGVAMGIKGTEVAKDASQMILTDDNFNTIVNAVKEGRRVYDNLKKTILFILPTNGAEAFLIFASILFGTMMPLTPVQILWVNMVTSVTISLAIAFEKLEVGTMQRPPREPKTKLLSGYYMFRIGFVSLLIGGGILWMNSGLTNLGYNQAVINTMTLQVLVIAQLFYLFNCRSERNFALNRDFFSNKAAFVVAAILILVQTAVTYLPFMNTILGTTPIAIEYWILPIIMGVVVFIVVEIEKWVTRRIVFPG